MDKRRIVVDVIVEVHAQVVVEASRGEDGIDDALVGSEAIAKAEVEGALSGTRIETQVGEVSS